MLWEPIYIIVCAAADILFTYLLINKAIALGKKNADEAEGNPVVRYFLKKYGLHKGTRVAATYSVVAITGVIFYLSLRYSEQAFRNMLYFIMGAYSLLMLVHISSFKFLNKQEVKRNVRQNKSCSVKSRKKV